MIITDTNIHARFKCDMGYSHHHSLLDSSNLMMMMMMMILSIPLKKYLGPIFRVGVHDFAILSMNRILDKEPLDCEKVIAITVFAINWLGYQYANAVQQ